MGLPDGARSRVVLIGTSRFDDPKLGPLPAVANNVDGLAAVLTNPRGIGMPPQQCRTLVDESNLNVVARALRDAAAEAEDLLFVYYAGHGVLYDNELWFSTPGTDSDLPVGSALRMHDVRAMLARAKADKRVLVLDCCFSGRAIHTMSNPPTIVAGQTDIEGFLILASVPRNDLADAPIGEAYTAFTGELLLLLHNGIPGGPELLTIHKLFEQLQQIFYSRGKPSPRLSGTQNIGELALARNPAADLLVAELPAFDGAQDSVDELRERSFRFDAAPLLLSVAGDALDDAPYRTSAELMRQAVNLSRQPDGLLVRVAASVMPAEATAAVRRLFDCYRRPGTAGELRYRLAHAGSGPEGALRMVEAARPPDVDEATWNEFVTAVEFVADPVTDLACMALLHNQIGAAAARGWWQEQVAMLRQHRDKPHEMVAKLKDARVDAARLRRPNGGTPDHEFRLWQHDDRAPSEVERGGVIVARTMVGPTDLRDGCFARRSATLDRAIGAFCEWQFDRRRHVGDGGLPIFWLGGEHGSGKSVLLLQLLSALSERAVGPIGWLGGRLTELDKALAWFEQHGGDWPSGVIALDDPYPEQSDADADLIWTRVIERYTSAVEKNSDHRLPLLVCCGPPRRLEAFQAEFESDLRLELFHVPSCDRTEITEVREWYVHRTGRQPSVRFEQNALPLHLLVEWEEERGDAPEPGRSSFAANYRRRVRYVDEECGTVEGLSLTEFIGRLAAMSRFEVGYPDGAVASLLDANRRERLRNLYVDHDREAGQWRLHARLAESVFNAWHGDAQRRSAVVAEAVADIQGWGDTPKLRNAPLWALAGMVRAGEIDEAALTSALPRLYEQAGRRSDGVLTVEDLPVWVELAAIRPDVEFKPHPVDTALIALAGGEPVTGTRLTCHKLLEHRHVLPQHAERIVEVVIEVLERWPNWVGWFPVALHAARRIDDPRLLRVLTEYVDAPATASTGGVLYRLLRSSTAAASSSAVSVITRRLPQAPATPTWAKIAHHAIENPSRDLRLAGQRWVWQHSDEFVIGRPLGGLLVKAGNGDRLWGLAAEWCGRWHSSCWANWVLERLVKHQAPQVEPRVWEWCLRWLEQDSGDPTFLFQQILLHCDQPRLLERVWTWLRDAPPEHAAWGHVWSELWRKGSERDELVALGKMRLRQTVEIDSPPWPWVWTDLWAHSADADVQRGELARLACQWLAAHPGHQQWSYVVLPLAEYDHAYADEVFRYLGEASTEEKAWPVIWDRYRRSAVATDEDKTRLNELGARWLRDHANDEITVDWPGIPIWWAVSRRERAVGDWPYAHIGLTWLRKVAQDDGSGHRFSPVSHIWRTLWIRGKYRSELQDLAVMVLRNTRLSLRQQDWMKLFRSVAQRCKVAALVPCAVAFLGHDHERRQLVPDIAVELADIPVSDELVRLVAAWLKDNPAPDEEPWKQTWKIAEGWIRAGGFAVSLADELRTITLPVFEAGDLTDADVQSLWLQVWDGGADRDVLVELLLAEMEARQLPFTRRTVIVWRRAREHRPGSVELEQLGHRWLMNPTQAGMPWADVFFELWRLTPNERVSNRLYQLLHRPGVSAEEVVQAIDRLLRMSSDSNLDPPLPNIRQLLRDELEVIGPTGNPMWGPVLAMVGFGSEGKLREQATQWLTTASSDAVPMWCALWESQRSAELGEWGLAWLAESSAEDPTWFQVWQQLRSDPNLTDRLDAVLDDRLADGKPVARSTEKAWRAAWISEADDPYLARYVERWLTQHTDHSGWTSLWNEAWEAKPNHLALARAARHWLVSQPANRAWARIASAVWRVVGDPQLRSAICDHVLTYSCDNQRRRELGPLWRIALSESSGEDIVPLARKCTAWLAGPGDMRGSGPGDVWLGCWALVSKSDRSDDAEILHITDELARLGKDWLARTDAYRGRALRQWAAIWTALWDGEHDQPALVRLANGVPGGRRNDHAWLDVSRRMLMHGTPMRDRGDRPGPRRPRRSGRRKR